jgi:hypothetical protein
VGRDQELRVGEVALEQLAELVAVVGVNRHHDVIQQREGELAAEGYGPRSSKLT